MEAQEIISFYLEHDILISPDMLAGIKDMEIPIQTEFSVINKEVLNIIENKIPLNVEDFEKSILLKEKYKNTKLYEKFLDYIENSQKKIRPQNKILSDMQKNTSNTISSEKPSLKVGPVAITVQRAIPEIETPAAAGSVEKTSDMAVIVSDDALEISERTPVNDALLDEEMKKQKIRFMQEHKLKLVFDYDVKPQKRTVSDFVGCLTSRYKDIEKILRGRQELANLTSISRINAKKERENVALIGFVYDKQTTKNNNIMFTIEDPTGFVKVVVNHTKEDLFALAQEIQLDEVIGVVGLYDKLIFANNLLLPDIPLTKELKKNPEEGYFVVIADPQLGNKLFLEKEFSKFISWMNAELGSETQRDIAKKVRYLFIVGDLVDGVGIYPGQEYDLNIIDVYDQYKAFAEHVKKLSPDLPIIVCPGNHDIGRMSEPQPGFRDEITRPVWSLPNVIAISNPSMVNICANSQAGFDGFDVLLYHGYSFFYYFEHIPSIRQKGGSKRADLVMKYLLQRRHLAPTHTSTIFIPDSKKDPLTIDKIPDFLFSGHVHRASVNNYRNVTCINASCWVSRSEEQERRGLEPQPARAFIVNMQTREVKVMNFLSKEDDAKEDGAKEDSTLMENQ